MNGDLEHDARMALSSFRSKREMRLARFVLDSLGGAMNERPEITWELTTQAKALLEITALAKAHGAIEQEEREELDAWIIRKDAAQN